MQEDVWDFPFKIFREKIGHKRTPIPKTTASKVISGFFPDREEVGREDVEVNIEEIPVVKTQDVTAAGRIATGKAPE